MALGLDLREKNISVDDFTENVYIVFAAFYLSFVFPVW